MGLLFKQPSHYVFDYKPLFYDPKKEDREKRMEQIKKELGIETEISNNYKPQINFKNSNIKRRRKDRSSAIRFMLILVFLMLFVYLYLFTSVIDKLLDKIL
jgi:uncharacterized membrane protein